MNGIVNVYWYTGKARCIKRGNKSKLPNQIIQGGVVYVYKNNKKAACINYMHFIAYFNTLWLCNH